MTTETEEAILRLATNIEVALNDHAVGTAQATKDAGAAVKAGLSEVAAAPRELTQAIRDGKRTP